MKINAIEKCDGACGETPLENFAHLFSYFSSPSTPFFVTSFLIPDLVHLRHCFLVTNDQIA
jgi:hypothetical protein